VKSGVANVDRNYRPPNNTGQRALNSVLAKAA